jgi:hypothetical protein
MFLTASLFGCDDRNTNEVEPRVAAQDVDKDKPVASKETEDVTTVKAPADPPLVKIDFAGE